MLTRRPWVRLSFSFLVAAAPFAVSAAARAEACGDQTCPKNWECQSVPGATTDLACAPGADCPAPPPPTTIEVCAPLPCSSDADCASDMVCYSETHTECDSAPPCAKAGDCPAPADSACTTVTQSACVPRYVPPCGADADCGVGFTCEAQEECACGGSTGTAGGPTPSSGGGSAGSSGSGGSFAPAPAADGGAADPAPPEDGGATPPDEKMAPDAGAPSEPPPDCVCTPTNTKTCKLVEVACNTASDCPAGFTCEDNPSGTCWASSDGTSGCDTPDPAKICAPPYTDLVRGVGHAADAGGELGIPTDSTGTGAPEPPKGDSGGTGPVGSNPDPGSGGQTSGSNTGSGAQAPTDNPTAPHDADPAQGSDEVVTHGGCSIASAPDATSASYGLVALGLVGLFGARRRRR